MGKSISSLAIVMSLGVDFHETFALVVRMETIRTFLALAAQMEL